MTITEAREKKELAEEVREAVTNAIFHLQGITHLLNLTHRAHEAEGKSSRLKPLRLTAVFQKMEEDAEDLLDLFETYTSTMRPLTI
ncbi:MAG: hypothetical protein HQK60_01735, partial [Deltaproteobacteria bacterium]|nr:hypothetical protein [Deltaproteobacteria bacterium]